MQCTVKVPGVSQSPYNLQQVFGLSAEGILLILFVKSVPAVFSLSIGKRVK